MTVMDKNVLLNKLLTSAENTRKIREAAGAIKEARLSGEPIAIVPDVSNLIKPDLTK